ncbi:uncharacterized protein LOC101458872 [Ceratitis capitata]|uniref:(Mediterranean fruit fly) hypothetical protein n=1 Tax=Ceratitis capitata TaxID=7213 RepID=A0A811U2X8_CERCA|nr:uncharacterized protein LOC101458872 [Ceratitis capitata]CAD6993374.1 unnamed protein product [Ceratitis capitata]
MMPTYITYNGTSKSIREIRRSFDMHQYAIYVGEPTKIKPGKFPDSREEPDLSKGAAKITFREPTSRVRLRRKGKPNVYPITTECTLFSDSEESGSEETENFKRKVNKMILMESHVVEDKLEDLKKIADEKIGNLGILITQQMRWNRSTFAVLGEKRLDL